MSADTLTNAAHLHLLLNHVPTVGFIVALAVCVVGRLQMDGSLMRAGLALLFAVAVVAIATYVTGNAAEDTLRGGADGTLPAAISSEAIRAHEDAALPAFALMELTGFAAWLTLWRWRRTARLANSYFTVVLILGVVTFGMMWRAAELGGDIHHPEMHQAAPGSDDGGVSPENPEIADRQPARDAGAGWAQRFGTRVIVGEKWIWPTLETVHFIGLCMLFAVVLVVNARLLGLIKHVPYAALSELLPIGILGFGLNLVSGIMFFLGVPGQYVGNTSFAWKIGFIVLGGLNALYFLVDERVWHLGAGDDAPLRTKLAAGSAIGLWAAVLFCGHMLPFLGSAF